MSPVTIYTKPFCPYCTRAKALLDTRSIPYTEITVETDAQKTEMMALTRGRSTFPQVFIGAVHIGGSDDLLEYHNKGYLKAAVQAASSVDQ